jgi:DDE family transposase
MDSMPLPVCRRAQARRHKKVRGRDYCGYCAAKREKFFGFRLHLICTPEGLPVSFAVIAGGYHDLTPLHELTFTLPPGVRVFGDKGYSSVPDEATILAETG